MFTPTKYSDHITSSSYSHQFCLLCFKNVNEYKSPKDHIDNLFILTARNKSFAKSRRIPKRSRLFEDLNIIRWVSRTASGSGDASTIVESFT